MCQMGGPRWLLKREGSVFTCVRAGWLGNGAKTCFVFTDVVLQGAQERLGVLRAGDDARADQGRLSGIGEAEIHDKFTLGMGDNSNVGIAPPRDFLVDLRV